MQRTSLNKIITVPNLLSFFRIALVPVISYSFLNSHRITCASFIVLSFITDVLDGYIARKFNMVSALGKALDPVADKLTLFSLLLCVSVKNPILYALVGVFIIKEVTVGAEGLILLKLTGTTYSAKWYGKLTTGLLYATCFLMVAFNSLPTVVVKTAFYTCVFFNLLSLVLYSAKNVKQIRRLSEGTVE
ncbi:MAG: CDP-alcohol phosphatidyltransferase family protein [Clostridia bacterium]|nr:CDP-alcohol phosphatidyltransferase family protein [Clostridia bacterium]